MSKKSSPYIIIIAILTILAALLWAYYSFTSETAPTSSTTTASTTSTQNSVSSHSSASSVSSVQSSESVASSESKAALPSTFLDESVTNEATYKKGVLPTHIASDELSSAINDYYKQQYTAEEKAANLTEIPQEELEALQTSLAQDNKLHALEAAVDQITIKLEDKTNYVTRIVVPMPYKQANSLVAESDIELMNFAFSHLGNRLVLVAYYDAETDTVTPVSLSNSLHPLFYNVE